MFLILVFYHFLIQRCFNIFLWETLSLTHSLTHYSLTHSLTHSLSLSLAHSHSLSELQNSDMLHPLMQIYIRIYKVPSKIIFFTFNCTFTNHQSSFSLFSANIISVYMPFWVLPCMHFDEIQVLWSNLFSLSALDSNTQAPYLNIATVLFIAFILFFPFNLDIKSALPSSSKYHFHFLFLLYHLLVHQGIYIVLHQSIKSYIWETETSALRVIKFSSFSYWNPTLLYPKFNSIIVTECINCIHQLID